MKHVLGLHSKEEQGDAIDLVMKAHTLGVDASAARDLASLAFQVGFIQAIWVLAGLEGAKTVRDTAARKRDDLDRRLRELL